MPRFRQLATADVRIKSGPLDIVTEADEAAERMITTALGRAFPGCLVVGEEAASADPRILAALGTADLAFVVDPVDGTSNYAAGLPLFGCMAAALIRGEVAGAVIHDPVVDTSAMALRGEDAWTQEANGLRRDLQVAAPVPVAEMTGAANWRFLPGGLGVLANRNLPKVATSLSFCCAAHEYRLAASGQLHYLVFGKLMPWDHAPGWLLHREAGGYSARLDGSPYSPSVHQSGLICAPDAESFHVLRAALLAP
jgi:fructose-1,6-bisphosphatase/inositol monophosphatase family enzyme